MLVTFGPIFGQQQHAARLAIASPLRSFAPSRVPARSERGGNAVALRRRREGRMTLMWDGGGRFLEMTPVQSVRLQGNPSLL
ncbi:hypothetical protein DUNSADRAFT_692 [Dunaliella salina]|uniref:Encoded protein n=1 Tax=Dunaliella salina TaxID=3046 RepID=A0ABQ7FYJ8_DUNSA|nr:hypothetical protein DUNSADRAFT_692 [Dunaliella salina]|eukprot:KAF5827421.1 hypothetical protein DUNSADRAFT_692 [Dunaliella salina]